MKNGENPCQLFESPGDAVRELSGCHGCQETRTVRENGGRAREPREELTRRVVGPGSNDRQIRQRLGDMRLNGTPQQKIQKDGNVMTRAYDTYNIYIYINMTYIYIICEKSHMITVSTGFDFSILFW